MAREIPNMKVYVMEQFKKGAEQKQYAKFAKVFAMQGVPGESIQTTMSNGLVETTNMVSVDEKTGEPDWIITNPAGEKYIVPDSTFHKKYESFDLEQGIYKPKGGVQKFIQIDEDISFTAPWGEKMTITAGGYINTTDFNDIYGVQKDEFLKTYAECNEKGEFFDAKLNTPIMQGRSM